LFWWLQVTATAEASSAGTAAALAAAAARVAELEEQAEQHTDAAASPVAAVAIATEPSEQQQQLAEAGAQTAGLRERQGRVRVRGAADEVMHPIVLSSTSRFCIITISERCFVLVVINCWANVMLKL
jgi:hypothetical protein